MYNKLTTHYKFNYYLLNFSDKCSASQYEIKNVVIQNSKKLKKKITIKIILKNISFFLVICNKIFPKKVNTF